MQSGLRLSQLLEDIDHLMGAQDFEGAELVLGRALSEIPDQEAFLHFQYGRLYLAWNKMSSAINHLNRATEILDPNRDATLWAQVTGELRLARRRQADQQP